MEQYLNEEEIQSIHKGLQRGESYEDFSTMCEIIVNSRLNFGHSGNRREETLFAVISLCGISWPGKPPSYKADVRKFRRSFRGINDNDTLRDHFRSRLTENLLAVESYTDLNFDDTTSIFHPAFPTARPAVMTAGAATSSPYNEEDDEFDDEEQSASANE